MVCEFVHEFEPGKVWEQKALKEIYRYEGICGDSVILPVLFCGIRNIPGGILVV